MKSIRQLAKEHNLKPEMVFERLKKGWTLDEALQPKGWKRPIDIQKRISVYDNELVYLGGYKSKSSKIKLQCKRCGTTFERTYGRLSEKSREGKLCCEICQRKKLEQIDTTEERERHFIEILKMTMPTFTYITGYKDTKSNVLIKCNKCGYEMYRGVDRLTRKNKNIVCKNCEKLKTKEKNNIKYQINKMILEQKKYIQQKRKEKQLQLHKIEIMFNKNTLYINNCIKCGKEYIEHSKSKYCAKCRKQINHHHSYKSLNKLYQRDNGICHICNELCDWNDKRIDKGTVIVGDNYPSIDHIIPLVKGGTDDWNNLGLAHMRCNTIKRDNQGYVSI